MKKKLLLAVAAVMLTLGQPTVAHAADCEEVCGEKAAQNCEDIDSVKCAAYIIGCLAGCSFQEMVEILGGGR